jgi:hypothetical protein
MLEVLEEKNQNFCLFSNNHYITDDLVNEILSFLSISKLIESRLISKTFKCEIDKTVENRLKKFAEIPHQDSRNYCRFYNRWLFMKSSSFPVFSQLMTITLDPKHFTQLIYKYCEEGSEVKSPQKCLDWIINQNFLSQNGAFSEGIDFSNHSEEEKQHIFKDFLKSFEEKLNVYFQTYRIPRKIFMTFIAHAGMLLLLAGSLIKFGFSLSKVIKAHHDIEDKNIAVINSVIYGGLCLTLYVAGILLRIKLHKLRDSLPNPRDARMQAEISKIAQIKSSLRSFFGLQTFQKQHLRKIAIRKQIEEIVKRHHEEKKSSAPACESVQIVEIPNDGSEKPISEWFKRKKGGYKQLPKEPAIDEEHKIDKNNQQFPRS